MSPQLIFIICLLCTLGVFTYSAQRLNSFFKLTKAFPINNLGDRFFLMLRVAFGQTKIFRFPVIGLLHALVFWGFCVILLGSIEIVIDGITGIERSLSGLGIFYDIIMASGDVFAFIIAISIVVFLFRRFFLHVKRFSGIEMKHKSHRDANFALTIIFLLMVSLLGLNIGYISIHPTGYNGIYPVSEMIVSLLGIESGHGMHIFHDVNWWSHILLIFFFANYLPYSKHFHVFMSVPNVFLSRLEPLGKLPNMDNITKEVKSMMNPESAFDESATGEEEQIERFGVLDIEDVTWKNYLDSLACTQCGRCTSVCPANLTGKKLSPRKVIMNLRERMDAKGPGMVKNGKDFTDGKSLIRDYISEEELWACTTCNACAQECPININHPTLIVDMRRYLVMEEAAAPGDLNGIFTNIENNGAPWQFSPEDRLLWTE